MTDERHLEKPGQPVLVRVVDPPGSPAVECVAIEIEGEELVLRVPGEGAVPDLPDDTRVLVQYADEAGICSYLAPVVSQLGTRLVVGGPASVERLQRRHYYRVGTDDPLRISVRPAGGGGAVHATTVDISGGGLRLHADRTFATGEDVTIIVALEGRPVELAARVVRGDEHEAALTYTEIPESERDKLIALVFDLQRRRLARA
jgi:hypothetical protein